MATTKSVSPFHETSDFTMRTAFKNFPFVTLPETKPDLIGFFEAIKLGGFEEQYVRIPAATQRRHFGYLPFGRLGVKVGSGGVCTTLRSLDYGSDYDQQSAFYDHGSRTWRSAYEPHEPYARFPR